MQVNNGTDLNVAFNTTVVDSTTTSRISSVNDAVTAGVGLVIQGTPLVFNNNAGEAMRISSGGSATFSGEVLSNSNFLAQGAYPSLALDSTSYSKFSLVNRYSTNRMSFDTKPQGGTNIEAAYLNNNGRFDFNYGIKFGTGATLDAYEEGTSTIYFRATGQSPTPTATANYTRVGNFVYYSFEVTLNATMNSNAYFDGLPYLPASGYPKSAFYVGFNTSTNSNGGNIPTSGTYAGTGFFYQRDSLSQSVWNTGTTYLTVSGSYQV